MLRNNGTVQGCDKLALSLAIKRKPTILMPSIPISNMKADRYLRGRRHELLFGGGDGFMGTQTHLPPKFSFSSDFGHFILKMVENAKFSYVS